MKDNMKEKDLTVDFFFGNEEINPFDGFPRFRKRNLPSGPFLSYYLS